MRSASTLAILVLFAGLELSGQSAVPGAGRSPGTGNHSAPELPLVKGTFRPRLPLQDALKIAEGFINKQQIDISQYWLYRAMFILLGSENTADKDNLPGWHFWWVSISGEMGNDVEIFVDMNGNASRMPSM